MNISLYLHNCSFQQKIVENNLKTMVSGDNDNKSNIGNLLRVLMDIGIHGVNEDRVKALQKNIYINNDEDHSNYILLQRNACYGHNKNSGDKNQLNDKVRKQLVKDELHATWNHKILLDKLNDRKTKYSGDVSDEESYSHFWEVIAQAINNIRANYLNFYAKLMEYYVNIYQKYNDTYVKSASQAVGAGKDASHVSWNTNIMNTAKIEFDTFCRNINLGCVPGWDKLTIAQRESIRMALQPAFNVDVRSGDGKISFNLDFYHKGPNPFPGQSSQDQYSLPEYQAWLASFNAVGNTFQSNMQSFAQTYSQVNSTFNNLNKILSSSITALGESANLVLRSLG
ncbi:IpaD/SipD/SspD family type III secretion system needle tip protein [Salmonella enterica]|nr:IpaD/SipD/SspD family type III secretion system needle tip protein [Salmonella enterica]